MSAVGLAEEVLHTAYMLLKKLIVSRVLVKMSVLELNTAKSHTKR